MQGDYAPDGAMHKARSLIDTLALKYGTDKASNLHNYTRWYEKHLPYCGPLTLLEIGVAEGKSLRMWRGLYGGESVIVGLDINPVPAIGGIRTFCGSATDPHIRNLISDKIGRPNIIIDDASHRWQDQIDTFKLYWPELEGGGVYVIEDLHTSYDMGFGEPGGQNALQFLHAMMDDVSLYGAGGLGDIRNCQGYHEQMMNQYQKSIESMTFYPSICFIRKNKCW